MEQTAFSPVQTSVHQKNQPAVKNTPPGPVMLCINCHDVVFNFLSYLPLSSRLLFSYTCKAFCGLPCCMAFWRELLIHPGQTQYTSWEAARDEFCTDPWRRNPEYWHCDGNGRRFTAEIGKVVIYKMQQGEVGAEEVENRRQVVLAEIKAKKTQEHRELDANDIACMINGSDTYEQLIDLDSSELYNSEGYANLLEYQTVSVDDSLRKRLRNWEVRTYMEPNSWLEQQLDSQECTNKDLSRLGRLHMHGLYDATKPIDQSKLTFKFNRRGRALLDERVQQAISDKKLMMELALRALNIEYYYDFVDYLHTDSYIKLLLSLIDPWMQGHFNGARSLFHKNYFHMVCTGAIDVFYHPDIKQAIDNQILTTEQVAITLFHHTGEVKKDALPQSIEAATQELLKEIKPVAKEEGGNCLIS